MHYSVPEAARLFGVAEDLVYDWIRNEGLPATFYGGRYHLNSIKLREWASLKQLPLPLEGSVTDPVLEDALRRGGVIFDVPSDSLGVALEEIFLRRLSLDSNIKSKILGMLRSRDSFGWSIAQDGVLLPSPRSPLVVLPDSPRVYIAYVSQDQKIVLRPDSFWALFVILVSAPAMHLNLLSRSLFVLRDPQFRELIAKGSGVESLSERMHALSVEPTRPLENDTIKLL